MILLLSYTSDTIAIVDRLAVEARFALRPFTKEELVTMVREALNMGLRVPW